jgi:hypothetical protein
MSVIKDRNPRMPLEFRCLRQMLREDPMNCRNICTVLIKNWCRR